MEQVISFLKNIWTTRYRFVKTYGVEPIIEGAGQMVKKSFFFNAESQSMYVNENYMLSRERVTVMTIMPISNKAISPLCLLPFNIIKQY